MNIENFKNKLEEERVSLIEGLNSIGVPDKDLKDNWDVTPADREEQIETHDEIADRMEDIEEREATKLTLKSRLIEVNHALAKIDSDSYGFCEIGNEPIEEDRLEANPAARTCKKHINEELPPIE